MSPNRDALRKAGGNAVQEIGRDSIMVQYV